MTNYVAAHIALFRSFVVDRVKNSLPEPYSGLILGFTLGYKQDYPEDITSLLISTGTIHLVVFSGSNVAVITGGLFPLFYKFRRLSYFAFSTLMLLLIVILVGLEAPVIRAVITKFIQNISKVFGFDAGSLAPLFYSAFLMLLVNKSYLLDISFQLSFAAAFIVIVIADVSSFIRESIYKSLLVNALVISFIYPLLSFYFGSFSLSSLFVNLLVGFVVEKMLLAGFLYLLWPNIVIGLYLMVFGHYFISISNFFGNLELLNSQISLNNRDVIIFYACFVFGFFAYKLYLANIFSKDKLSSIKV